MTSSRRPPCWPDRVEAGAELGARLAEEGYGPDALVVGLPRGGVVVAAQVAAALGAELDALVVRKVGTPGHPELAAGAVGPGGVLVVNDDVVRHSHLAQDRLDAAVAAAREEVADREARLRPGRDPVSATGRTVLVVDDGLATGATALAAVRVLRSGGPASVVVAVPVGAPQAVRVLAAEADDVVALVQPPDLGGVGAWYADFTQTTDAEVRDLLGGRPG